MKKLLFFSLSLLGLNSASFAQWTQLNFTPSQNLYSVHCINYDTVVAVGDSGYIVRTVNSGIQWNLIPSNTTNTLYKVSFVNNTIGYAIGTKGTVLKTTDYGQSWSNIGISTNMSLLSMSFINKDTGWVAGGTITDIASLYGNKGILMKTFNGGANWSIDSTYNKAIASVFFIDKDTGYVCANYYNMSFPANYVSFLNKTTDSGNSFSIIKQDSVFPGGYYTDVQFINAKTGFFVDYGINNNCGVYKTTDYGNTWNNILYSQGTRNLFVIDSCTIYTTFADGMIGCSFSGQDICQGNYFNLISNSWVSASFIKKNKGFAVSGYLYCTTNSFIYKLDTTITGIVIQEQTLNEIELFPNPGSGIFNLKANQSEDLKVKKLKVYDVLGECIYQLTDFKINSPSALNKGQGQIDLSSQPSGIYFLKINTEDKTIIKKIIIQRE